MAQNAFRPYRGDWIMQKRTAAASTAAIEKGDLIQITSGGVTVALGTATATAIVGIAAEDSALSTSTREIRVLIPKDKTAEMIGRVTDGAIAVGETDGGRTCDLEDHEGADTDTDTHHHLQIVRGTVAAADGSVGEAIFRIAQTELDINSF